MAVNRNPNFQVNLKRPTPAIFRGHWISVKYLGMCIENKVQSGTGQEKKVASARQRTCLQPTVLLCPRDVMANHLWTTLKRGLSVAQRGFIATCGRGSFDSSAFFLDLYLHIVWNFGCLKPTSCVQI